MVDELLQNRRSLPGGWQRVTPSASSGGLLSRVATRRQFGFLGAALGLSLSQDAFAGSYLDRAALLVRHAREEADYLRARLGDRELARMVQGLAEGRLQSARSVTVPKEVEQAHPHLLLMLEDYERAADAAADRRGPQCIVLQNRARDEEQIFRGILRQLGLPLPDGR
jgi:hypothetical protein